MTDTTELPDTVAHLVGERIYCLDPAGITVLLEPGSDDLYAYPKTMTLARGQELVLTGEILLASLDRKGNSFFELDEYAQRARFNGVPRFGFGEYPEEERRYDFANAPDDSRLIQSSTVIASYKGDRGDRDIRGLRPGLRAQW